jgi:hypothetical protein
MTSPFWSCAGYPSQTPAPRFDSDKSASNPGHRVRIISARRPRKEETALYEG